MTKHSPTQHIIGHNRAVFDGLHPTLYKAMCGLALWFAVSAWVLFSGYEYTSLIFAIVSVFFLIAILVPTALWLTWRRRHEDAENNSAVPFDEWRAATFDTWQGRLSGREAAVQVLLPIAAVAFGLTAIGIVLHLAGSGGA